MKAFPYISAFTGIAVLVTVSFFTAVSSAYADICFNGILYNDKGEKIDECSADTFPKSSIFGCNKNGAYAMSEGALASTYVPVNDAAVRLTTGYLAHKECILDGISRKVAESATAGLVSKGITDVLTGRDGEPMWPVNLRRDELARSDQVVSHILESGVFSPINPAFRDDVARAYARNYMQGSRGANQELACPYEGDLDAVLKGQSNDVWGGLMAIANPACNPLGAYNLAREYAEVEIALDREEMFFRLNTGQGLYGIEQYSPLTGQYITLTPGYVVAENLQTLTMSGLRQQENVTEIDQMVGALFSGLGTQAITDSRGLVGLIQEVAGQPSYLDQLLKESKDKLKNTIVNHALNTLKAARKIEEQYHADMEAIVKNLIDTIKQLHEEEETCWGDIIENVCSGTPSGGTCTGTNGSQLTIATSTTRSQQVIENNIDVYKDLIEKNVTASEKALIIFDNLISGITHTSSEEAQKLALIQLENLTAQDVLHDEKDINDPEKGSKQLRKDVKAAMNELLEDTFSDWKESTEPTTGWCNINNPPTIQMWLDKWKK